MGAENVYCMEARSSLKQLFVPLDRCFMYFGDRGEPRQGHATAWRRVLSSPHCCAGAFAPELLRLGRDELET